MELNHTFILENGVLVNRCFKLLKLLPQICINLTFLFTVIDGNAAIAQRSGDKRKKSRPAGEFGWRIVVDNEQPAGE